MVVLLGKVQQGLIIEAGYRSLAFERSAHEIAFAPDQPTFAYRAEVVERDAEFEWHDVQAVQENAGPEVGYVANVTGVNAIAASEVH